MYRVGTILIPVDFSHHSARSLEVGVDLAKAFGAEIHLLHCYQAHVGGVVLYGLAVQEGFVREVRKAAERRLAEWSEKVKAESIKVSTDLTPLFPSEAISAAAKEIGADLIVMGTRGLTGLKHVLLGSVAERTIRNAPCPVLTVKAPEEE
jgi:universal stress protein A